MSLASSGGCFIKEANENFSFKEKGSALFEIWGDTPRVDGGLIIELPVYWWTLTSSNFYT